MVFKEKNKRLNIIPDKESVLLSMGCQKGDLLYKSVSEEYDTLFKRIAASLDARRSICVEDENIYVMLTAGEGISRLSSELFSAGEGLAGLIVNNAADDVIFRADKETSEYIKYICAEKGKGISKRREAPGDMPLEEQAEILEKAPVDGVGITEKYMITPSKSMGYVLELTDDKEVFKAQHDCSKCPKKDCPRRSSVKTDGFEIIRDFEYKPETASGIAIDIGTTTIAAMRLENGKIKGTYSVLNPQRRFGADVLSRIEAANHGRAQELKAVLEYKLKECISKLDGGDGRVTIAANTTMISLLLGYDCSKLGIYPFKAQSLEAVHDKNVSIAGGISAFVGGDITSGLYMCGFDENRDINLFIDLGTNGEMAIGNRERILCTSTAAGPAFEGGKISCGTGSVEGAVCAVSLKENKITTIGDKKPVGICGTGIIELIAELLENGIMDKTGWLIPDFENGYELCKGIKFTQRDIRELQTAKSAVRAGTEMLIKEYGCDERDIKNVFIAGGFGKRLNIEKACATGLLPKRFEDRCKAVGNSSLGGCIKALERNDAYEAMDRIRSAADDFALAEKEEFTEMFLKYMEF